MTHRADPRTPATNRASPNLYLVGPWTPTITGPAEAMTPATDGANLLGAWLAVNVVAAVFGQAVPVLLAPTRKAAQTAMSRQIAMYLTHVTCGVTLTAVGRMFGRDRTTVAHACSHIEDRRDDRRFDNLLGCLEDALVTYQSQTLYPKWTGEAEGAAPRWEFQSQRGEGGQSSLLALSELASRSQEPRGGPGQQVGAGESV